MSRKKYGIKAAHEEVEYTREMIEELKKCANDPIYFIKNYVYIKTVKKGKSKFDLYDYQIEYIKAMMNNDRVITKMSRQVGKTATTMAFLLWWAIFKYDQVILIASNNSTNAKEVIDKIKYAYEELPDWLKPGIDPTAYNKHEMRFDNRSRIVATATSENSGRGMSISFLYCDELAFVPKFVSEKFWDSIIPTVSQGGRIVISSTPNGDVGKYAEIWRMAESKIEGNEFFSLSVPWNAPPGRDEAFKKKYMAILGERKWRQEYECVVKGTLLTIRDVVNGVEEILPIEELDRRIWNTNQQYEVLTENGFKSFYDISKKVVDTTIKLTFDDGSDLGCSLKHAVKTINGFKEAKDLVVGDVISPNNITVVDIEYNVGDEIVYDLVNVEDGNHYLTNNVTSHNCEFLSEELTLIDGALITPAELRIEERVKSGLHIKHSINDGKFQFFEYLKRDATYLVGCDPSTGTGNDGGIIQVFEFPSMVQILEYSSNTLSPQVLYVELKSILKYLEQATSEIYFSVENNGVGQGVLAAYEGDMDPPSAALVSDSGSKLKGVNSNVKTKLRACIQFKEAFERGKLTINSPDLLKELKSFVRHSGSYAAQKGATDDRIMACMVCYYIIQQLATSHGDAYDMVYTVAEDIEARYSWSPPTSDEVANMNATKSLEERNASLAKDVDAFSYSDVMDEFFNRLHGISNDTNYHIF